MSWFVRLQLSDYEVMFHESLEGAWLDKVDHHYAWLRCTLITYEEECQSIFPAEWAIPEKEINFRGGKSLCSPPLKLIPAQATCIIVAYYIIQLSPKKPPKKPDASESDEPDDEDVSFYS